MTSTPSTSAAAETKSYTTAGGILVTRRTEHIDPEVVLPELISALDSRRGVLLSSGYDYPGRYTRWDLGFVDPPLVFVGNGRKFEIRALNQRGTVVLPAVYGALRSLPAIKHLENSTRALSGEVVAVTERFAEEERSRQPSLFSVLRAITALFYSDSEPHLGLYGAFGYDLCFQFEPSLQQRTRPVDQRDLVLYLPDTLVVVDRQKERAARFTYDFSVDGNSTEGQPRTGSKEPYVADRKATSRCDHAPGEYATAVERARESFAKGDLFELVLSQTFHEPCPQAPSAIFRTLQKKNPAPYALFLNLGNSEYLVGASPEMYVRVKGQNVETCPISGTIPRGSNAVEDAEQIRQLLLSKKDESELTMCTDVDRNDKSRICEPGSVRVIGRRQIELYSRLIHTVDHVSGTLRPDFDALDAFLSHTWAVTVTGAPKPAAIARVEIEEKSPRAWYGGAIGVIGFDGNLNTGLTLRTVRIKNGQAEVRAGATLLFDSDPSAEEEETRVKASAFLDALRPETTSDPAKAPPAFCGGQGMRVLLVDHHDSFVHTLANYFRQTGAEVTTLRTGFSEAELHAVAPDLVVLSPGPGTPSDFNVSATIEMALKRDLPIFGVCLGLQSIVEHFGGTLGTLEYPMHGKPSDIVHDSTPLFAGLATTFQAGRYHSLFAKTDKLPDCLRSSAKTLDGVVMAIEHRELPIAAVQFHPESILSMRDKSGLILVNNALRQLRRN